MSQLEVSTRVHRRRRFTQIEKEQILAEAEATSTSAVCRRHDIARSLVKRWKDAAGSTPFARLELGTAPVAQGVRVELPGPMTIHFPVGVDPQSLAAFVRFLGAPI